MLFSRKERAGEMESDTSPNLSSDEINSQQKAEAANQDSHSQTQHFPCGVQGSHLDERSQDYSLVERLGGSVVLYQELRRLFGGEQCLLKLFQLRRERVGLRDKWYLLGGVGESLR